MVDAFGNGGLWEDTSVTAKPRHYRCTKGHEWTVKDAFGEHPVVTIRIAGKEGTWCMRCIVDMLNAGAGMVVEVTPADDEPATDKVDDLPQPAIVGRN